MRNQPAISWPVFKNLPLVMRRATKRLYQRLILKGQDTKRIVFVVGCQRSGTTMLASCFDHDLRAKVYGELSPLSVNDAQADNLRRLKPYEEVNLIMTQERAPLIIAKPLVESQNIVKLLNYFPQSKAIWIYRNYQAVASSNIKKFGFESALKNLRPLLNGSANSYWATQGASTSTAQLVRKYFSETMLPHDAAALFWYMRNVLFFELQLDTNPNVFLCKYEDIVAQPGKVMRNIYRFLEENYPGDNLIKQVRNQSHDLARRVEISKDIEKVCLDLLQKLDQTYEASITATGENGESVLCLPGKAKNF